MFSCPLNLNISVGVIVGVVLPVRKWAAPNRQIHRTQKQHEMRSFLSYFPPMACHWAVALWGTRGDLVSSTKSLKAFWFWHLDVNVYNSICIVTYWDYSALFSKLRFSGQLVKEKNNIPLPSTYYLLLPHRKQLQFSIQILLDLPAIAQFHLLTLTALANYYLTKMDHGAKID